MHLPRFVADHRLSAAVGEFYFNFAQKAQGALAVGAAVAAAHAAAPPGVAHHGGHGIGALFQQFGDVVRLIMDPVGIVGPARRQPIISDSFAVDVQHIAAETGDIDARLIKVALDVELFARQNRAQRLGRLARFAPDPSAP